MLSCGAAFPWGRFRGLWPGMLDPAEAAGVFPDPVMPGIAMSLGQKLCQESLPQFSVSSPWHRGIRKNPRRPSRIQHAGPKPPEMPPQKRSPTGKHHGRSTATLKINVFPKCVKMLVEL